MAVEDLPHIDDYKEAFELAKETLEDQGGPTAEQVVDRITQVLDEYDPWPCLVCVDHGIGLSGPTIQNLYSEGITNKQGGGRGSVGHGHLTAFAVSYLRYVLYAGRHHHADTDETRDLFAGHAIVATHGTSNGVVRTQQSADGFITDKDADSEYVADMRGTPAVPDLLRQYLPDDAGSAVMICGYWPLNESTGDLTWSQVTLGAVAKNFMVAIARGDLAVKYTDETGENGETAYCDKTNLEETLGSLSHQKNRTKRTAGPAGAVAFSLWTTVKNCPESVELDGDLAGTTIWWRPLPPDDTRTRVALYREGMWITDECPELRPADFGENAPFSAVVNVARVSDDCFETLVRAAEGATHLEIRPSELTDVERRERLGDLLVKLRGCLADLAPRRDSNSFVPEAFKLFELPAEGKVTPAPRAKPRQVDRTDDRTDETLGEQITDVPASHEGTKKGKKTAKRKEAERDPQPKPGNAAGVRTTARLLPDGTVKIGWDAEGGFSHGAADVRISIPSGSDETSLVTVRPNYLRLRQIEIDGKVIKPGDDSSVEIRVEDPPAAGTAIVELESPPNDLDGRTIDASIVHRRQKATEE
ncbi:MAG TPA: hypothetical protein DEP69_06900 [Acidimicrobiaceae bacterium]|nr:hypothetical protein [Acidimicrobiaceae bacterium]